MHVLGVPGHCNIYNRGKELLFCGVKKVIQQRLRRYITVIHKKCTKKMTLEYCARIKKIVDTYASSTTIDYCHDLSHKFLMD